MLVQLVTSRYDHFPNNGSAANVWSQVLDKDRTRIGITLQNQHPSANFWVCNRQPQHATQAIRLTSGVAELREIFAPQDEVWIMSDTAGAYLSFCQTFTSEVNA